MRSSVVLVRIIILLTIFGESESRRRRKKVKAAVDPARVRLQNDVFDQPIVKYPPRLENKTPTDGYRFYEAETAANPVNVTLALTLQNLISVQGDIVDLNGWLSASWIHPNLTWNPADYDTIDTVTVTDMEDQIWVPDISLYNSIEPDKVQILKYAKSNALVSSNGHVNIVEPIRMKVQGNFNGDRSNFTVAPKFGCWAYNGMQVDMRLKKYYKVGGYGEVAPHVDVTAYQENSEWTFVNSTLKRTEAQYACCVETYVDIVAEINFARNDAGNEN